MREIPLNDWDEVVRTFEDMPDPRAWLFRGQLDARWVLRTSLERHLPRAMSASEAEGKMLREFKRRAHTYLASQQLPAEDNSAEWLALMQHYGAPTRLLDFTRSPYVATYFAVEDMQDGVETCAVWAIDTLWCRRAAGEAILKQQPDRRQLIEEVRKKDLLPVAVKDFTAEQIQGIESSLLLDDKWRENRTAVVVPYEPERLTERLSIQQGGFLVPRNIDNPFMDNLTSLGDSGEHVTKYLIPIRSRDRILERLRTMNITRAQLFPGLDGYAQSFRTHLIEEPADARGQRLAYQALFNEVLKRQMQE